MTGQPHKSVRRIKKNSTKQKRLPFECVALVLQGGGALGSYQAGVYEALAEAEIYPDWIAGISIGAINAAIIAGNPPERRVAKLRGFWETITAKPGLDWVTMFDLAPVGDLQRSLFNKMSANYTLMEGAHDFFIPRSPAPFVHPDGTVEATSFYDTSILKTTLERFIDFDRINQGKVRFSVGAVNVRTGNFIYFDNTREDIRPEHIIASGSLPPGFAATEIDGEFYWDGGLVSNTPLQWVVDGETRQDTLAFQVDLWSARGAVPINLSGAITRQKEIQYSSRTRAATDRFKHIQRVRYALANLLSKLPSEFQDNEEMELLKKVADHKAYSIVQLIYHAKQYEGHSKDYEFSRLSMEDHWQAGYQDASFALQHPKIFKRPNNKDGVFTFDFTQDSKQGKG
ncbi:MAG: patatin-like phospholipase family protein [Legionella sp.]|nr:patatin-like phospholipase family protein [Legionella sp.]